MFKPFLALTLAALLAAGCASGTPGHIPPGNMSQPRSSTIEAVTDDRINDPDIVDKDPELNIGDLGIDDGSFGVRPFAFQEATLNSSIMPLDGNYANNVIAFGTLFMGTPYEYGSDRDNASTFDCSDFTRYAFLGSLGLDLPKDSRSQEQYVKTFSKRSYTDLRKARRGDLLFFMDYKGFLPENYTGIDVSRQIISHTGIYLGNGNMLHTASKATGGVRIDYIFGKHLEWRFVSGGTVLP